MLSDVPPTDIGQDHERKTVLGVLPQTQLWPTEGAQSLPLHDPETVMEGPSDSQMPKWIPYHPTIGHVLSL